jgi:AdoMet-dependent rRNA methyltransferase SPB1
VLEEVSEKIAYWIVLSSLSSGEEEEGDEVSAAGTRQPSKEEEEEEQLNQTLAEMKAEEVAELKR